MNTPHKHAELIKAWADGALIQMKDRGSWTDLHQLGITWSTRNEYRIKPEVTTSLSNEELCIVYYEEAGHLVSPRVAAANANISGFGTSLRRVADVAIKQYIKDTQK